MKQSALFLVTALTTLFAPAATAQTMFVVDYVQSRTLGDRVIDSEEGTHTFSPDGHRRTDRLVRGEHTTEIVIPGETLGEGERIEINHTLVVARRGPLNVVPGRSLARQRSLTRTRPVPPDLPQYRAAQRRRESGQSTPMDYVGQEERGPLTLHHYRTEFPEMMGMTVDRWDYRFGAGTSELTLQLERTIQQVLPDGQVGVDEMRITNVSEVPFDRSVFTDAIPAGMPVEDLWDGLVVPR